MRWSDARSPLRLPPFEADPMRAAQVGRRRAHPRSTASPPRVLTAPTRAAARFPPPRRRTRDDRDDTGRRRRPQRVAAATNALAAPLAVYSFAAGVAPDDAYRLLETRASRASDLTLEVHLQ